MREVTVKVGFVPSYRFLYSPWCQKMRDDSLAAFAHVAGLEVVAPQPAPDGAGVDAGRGQTPHGMVSNLDEADAAADYFAARKVDALILCPLDFGDERSAAKIAERLQVPVLLYATREPPAPDEPGMGRVSDSYCGCLSMASALYRRKLPFHYAGIFFPDEPAFLEEVERFAAAVAVVAGLRNARIGQVGVRPATFETVGYDEAALIQKFGQNVVYAELADVVRTAEGIRRRRSACATGHGEPQGERGRGDGLRTSRRERGEARGSPWKISGHAHAFRRWPSSAGPPSRRRWASRCAPCMAA